MAALVSTFIWGRTRRAHSNRHAQAAEGDKKFILGFSWSHIGVKTGERMGWRYRDSYGLHFGEEGAEGGLLLRSRVD